MLYLTNVYGAKYGASALAANGLLRYLVGGSFPLFTIPSMSLHLLPLKGHLSHVFLSVQKPWLPLGLELARVPGSRVRLFTMDLLHIRQKGPSD
jgi:hypothetical protein